MGRELVYLRKAAEATGNELVCPSTLGRESTRVTVRIPFTPDATRARGASTRKVLLGGIRDALDIIRTLSRIGKGAARGHV